MLYIDDDSTLLLPLAWIAAEKAALFYLFMLQFHTSGLLHVLLWCHHPLGRNAHFRMKRYHLARVGLAPVETH